MGYSRRIRIFVGFFGPLLDYAKIQGDERAIRAVLRKPVNSVLPGLRGSILLDQRQSAKRPDRFHLQRPP